jgi:Cupin superfamily protein
MKSYSWKIAMQNKHVAVPAEESADADEGASGRERVWQGEWGSGAFWDHFSREHWERRPLSGQNVLRLPPTDVWFDAVVRAASGEVPRLGARHIAVGQVAKLIGAHYRPAGVMTRFTAAGRSSWRVPERLRPRAEDGGFAGYHQRVTAELARAGGDGHYGLIVNNPELISPELYRWARAFVAPLYRRAGMNNSGNYLAMFIGNYLRTPFGVHWDPESVFSVPVVGRKAMRTWPSRAPELEGIRHKRAYPEAGSQRMEAEPGGVLYWPSDAWHIAESEGELSVSVAVSLTHRYPAQGDPIAAMVPLAAGAKGERGLSELVRSSVHQVPAQLDLGDRVGRGGMGAGGARAQWLRRATALGFLQTPALSEAKLPAAATGSVLPGALAWIDEHEDGTGELLVGAAGHVRRWPRVLTDALEQLQREPSLPLAPWIAQASGSGNASLRRELADWLTRAGALAVATT